jgi:hypothetical protein
MILDGSNGVTFNDASLQGAAASPYVLKNRIINGAMVIDQRNAGASVTPTTGQYTLDRWQATHNQASKFSVQQNAGAVTPPTGFTNYLGVTSLSSYAVLTGDYFLVGQRIEGFNTADLDFGKATAKTVTLSFWVRSSLTGTFGGVLQNSAVNRSYPFTYTISVANTWELKSVTVAGDTSGTWVGATNGNGLTVYFGLGVGTTYSGTAGAWAGSNFLSATGATSVVGTNGATWYVTGVQLEQNTSATPFERRLYNQELANCQRYCYSVNASGEVYTRYGVGECYSTVRLESYIYLPVNMRIVPSLTTTGTASNYAVYSANVITSLSSVPVMGGGSTVQMLQLDSVVASGLTAGRAGQLLSNNNTTSYLTFSAEL